MTGTIELTPTEHVIVRSASADVVEVEGVYQPNGSPPPKHWHPEQSEHFEVLEGTLRARVDGEEHTLNAGETLDIPAGAVHQMWNPDAAVTRVTWQTTPGGRTLEWFTALGKAPRGKNGMPGLLTFGVLLTEYRDVFRLAGPDPVLRPALSVLGLLGRALARQSR